LGNLRGHHTACEVGHDVTQLSADGANRADESGLEHQGQRLTNAAATVIGAAAELSRRIDGH
jgi:hypothetical protein